MHIGFFHAYFPPNSGNIGGIVPYLVTATQALARAGHQVTMVTAGSGKKEKRYVADGVQIIELVAQPADRWKTRGIVTGTVASWVKSKSFAPVIESLKLDVLEVCDFLNEAVFISRAVSCPVIVRLHTAALNQCPGRTLIRTRVRRWIDSKLERNYFAAASLLSAPSVEAARAVAARHPSSVAVDIVPNCVDTSFWRPGECVSRKPGRLLFAGRLQYGKGIDRLPSLISRLMERNDSIEMIFAGSEHVGELFPDGAERWIRARLSDNSTRRVRFVGALDREQLRQAYQSSAILLVPSRVESFGLVACEAMACGCVPIVQTGTGLVDVVEDSKSGLVVDFDQPELLAERILHLVNDESKIREMSIAGRSRAEEMFSAAAFAKAWTSSTTRMLDAANKRTHQLIEL